MEKKLTEHWLETSMQDCTLCPRQCHVNRKAGQIGYCGQTDQLKAARAALHFWEEPCISGTEGSGAVFFSGCSLRCIFCQNYNIAMGKAGRIISPERLVEIFLELQAKGANNINLVTPTHFLPQIAFALEKAKLQGLSIPILYNTGSYEEVDSLRRLEGLIDIYLPDLKYYAPEVSSRYAHAPDYFEKAIVAIAEMFRQVGVPVFTSDSRRIIKRGMIVRHLILPGQTKDSKKILRFLKEAYGNDIYVSIMNQYTPLPQAMSYPPLNRKVTEAEYQRVLLFAEQIGIEQGYCQEGEAASESFIPEFNEEGL